MMGTLRVDSRCPWRPPGSRDFCVKSAVPAAPGVHGALDYYGNQAGLDRKESGRLMALQRDYTAQLLMAETNPEHVDFLIRVNRLPFYQLGKSYVLAMLQRNNILDDIDINYMLIRNLSDKSGQQALNVEYRWLNSLTLYGGVNYFSGGENTEFGRFLNRQVIAGVNFYF